MSKTIEAEIESLQARQVSADHEYVKPLAHEPQIGPSAPGEQVNEAERQGSE